ncbi:hypothetical protein [Paenibacillus sinensis]|nr:hypothetical protein [Paenibacillus sinensis]
MKFRSVRVLFGWPCLVIVEHDFNKGGFLLDREEDEKLDEDVED